LAALAGNPDHDAPNKPQLNHTPMRNFFIAIVIAFVAVRPAMAQDANTADQTFMGFQVDHQVRIKSAVAPQYPETLRTAKVEGEVLVQFVVNEHGEADMSSFKVLRSTNTEFTDAVRRAVSAMTFYPADAQGKKVKQLVQQPFRFAAHSN
jgi:TonB family protein